MSCEGCQQQLREHDANNTGRLQFEFSSAALVIRLLLAVSISPQKGRPPLPMERRPNSLVYASVNLE